MLAAALAALALPLNHASASTTRRPPKPDPNQRTFTHAQALDLLGQAKSRLRRDTRRARIDKPVGHGRSTEITMTLRDLFLARSALTGEDRKQADAILARPSDPNGDYYNGEISYDGQTPRRYCPAGGNVCVHYVTAGPERVPDSNANHNLWPDYVETVATVMQQVWDYETSRMGYKTPLLDDGSPTQFSNPDGRLDTYLADLGSRGLYGYCTPEGPDDVHQLPGYCVLDNDYSRYQYGTLPGYALRVTAAHEFFHAVQFAYDVDEDPWFMEGTATWIEDELYDNINDNVQYLAFSNLRYPRAPADYSTGLHRYGDWLFFKFASEYLHDRDIVRRMWERADVDAGNSYSLQAVESAVTAATSESWADFFTMFTSWDTLPAGTYSERSRYPSPVYLRSQFLSSGRPSTGWLKFNRPHLSSAAVRVGPDSRLSPYARLIIQINGPDTSHGTTALIQTRFRDGHAEHTRVQLNAYGNLVKRIGFNRRTISSVVIIVANTSTSMKNCGRVYNADGPIYSCAGQGVYDSSQIFQVRAQLL